MPIAICIHILEPGYRGSILESPPVRRRSPPWQLIAIIVVTVVPIIAAYIAYFTGVGVPQDHVNEGTLLKPVRSVEDLITDEEWRNLTAKESRPWRLLVPVPYPCEEQCQEHLYITRQVHVRLGDKSHRVERYAVNLGASEGAAYLDDIAAEHPLLKRLAVTPTQWQTWLEGTNAPVDVSEEHYYLLIDQVGYAMMYYDRETDGNQLLKDIKRVLRYSPE